MIDMMKIGKFISKCRKEKGLTQAQLAEKFGITDRAVSKWETGKSIPDASLMLELCSELGITVNELLSGERLDMTNYNVQAEKNLMALKENEERANSKLLFLEVVIGVIGSVAFLILILVAMYAQDLPTAWRVALGVAGTVIFLFAACVCLRIEQTAGYYECPHCAHAYVPTTAQVWFAPHMGRTRHMKCPHCHKKGWNKKILSKTIDGGDE